MDLQLTGKRAVVTGGSRGIGLAVADRLAEEGAHVALVARDRAALETAAARVRRHGTTVLVLPTDTTDDAAVRAMVGAVVGGLGGVDVLVNAAARPAGSAPVPALADLHDDALRAELETKVLGYLRCARAVAPHMTAQGWGRIVNVSGLNARRTGSLAGSVRNVAVAAMTANLADELGPAGVTVTVVHPGTTVTERTPAVLAALAEREGSTPDAVAARLAAGTSIGRLVTADEVADVVAFLASPRSAAVTGDAIAVGGGTRGAIHY
ncbi:SDR family NAD(P)-dependent oxidoreductase [Modestobacter sp. I12A-02628]|uniref:SDR family NAD(P)-dependent oxidoreductase n=1 Tax=Goekera deserti TaxID=2497753 RepID=A0A7K3WIN9_9ACTN|nr:SDR family NAD(P)-dependent oxidoreductase [Goekera deserti]MPQ97064.1 SDR family NAD(P)-dependent oxidoreductase [Goekera deserti]NDI46619.1 SDR family NAD(P)-dependent oxidoreductase [Goekera deserti]NEL56375.1 SDR family NAD(P)-dependent oxidoreductase [Goekera deserti]